MESIKEVLMRRDNMHEEDAERLIKEAKEQFNEYLESGEDYYAENICEEYFGLEPDYIIEFL